MKTEGMGEIVKALIKAQKAFKQVIRDRENPFFKSKYADLANYWDACKEALHANGLTVIQTTGFDNGQFGVFTTLAHESGQSMTGFYVVNPVKQNDPQAIGSAVTYARRYALAAVVGLAPEDDDGNVASGKHDDNPEPTREPVKTNGNGKRTISEAQGRRLYAMWKGAHLQDDEVREYIKTKYGFNSTREITADVYEDICNWVESHGAVA